MSASQRVVSKLNFALAQFGFRKRGAVLERPIVYSTSGFLGLTPRILDDGGVKVFVVAGVRQPEEIFCREPKKLVAFSPLSHRILCGTPRCSAI